MLQTNIRFCCWRIIWVVCLMSPLLFAAIITLSITNHRVHRTTTGSTATTEPTTTLIKNTTSTIVILPSLGNGRYARLSRRYLAEPQVSDGLIQGCMVDNNKILPNQVSGSESQCLKFVDDPLNFYCLLFFLVVALLWCVSWLFGDYYCSTIDRNLGLRNADVHPTTAWCNRYSRSKSEYSDDLPVRDYHKTRIGTQNGKSSRGNHLSDDDSFHDENGLNKSLDDNAASNARHPVERRMYVEIFGLTKFLKMVVPKLYGEPISDLEHGCYKKIQVYTTGGHPLESPQAAIITFQLLDTEAHNGPQLQRLNVIKAASLHSDPPPAYSELQNSYPNTHLYEKNFDPASGQTKPSRTSNSRCTMSSDISVVDGE